MKEIQLTQGFVALVDDSDFDFLNQWKWYVYRGQYTNYAVRDDSGNPVGKLRMHRVILGLLNRKILCDHIDHNGLNNQRSNLRIATYSQNGGNRIRSRNYSSKFKGVRLIHNGSWRAQIKIMGKFKGLGHYRTEEEAARVYDEAAIKYYGEFANLNFK